MPTPSDVRRWRRYLAEERAEEQVYRWLAARRTGEERDILLALAEAERRHERHWLRLLGDDARPARTSWVSWVLRWFAARFGSVFVLALAQNAEARKPYATDRDASPAMAADEAMHEEVVRGLAARGRTRLSGIFRAAVFGANDGLVSNLALVVGMAATGVSTRIVLAAGLAGLLAGALSMAAGEYISVRSARELLAASQPGTQAQDAVQHLDLDDNELALVYRSRGMAPGEAARRAEAVLAEVRASGVTPVGAVPAADTGVDEHEAVGNAGGAAWASFAFFASGALIPVLPFVLGLSGALALGVAAALVGVALLLTGSVVGLLSGAPPLRRGARQVAIGYAAAGATYLLGLAFGVAGVG